MFDKYEKLSRLKVRFASTKGALTAEDLWDLPLSSTTGKANLDDVARDLYSQLQSTANISFVVTNKKPNEVTELALEFVKHVIDTKMQESAAASLAVTKREQKAKIMEAIARRQDDHLNQASIDDLQTMLANM